MSFGGAASFAALRIAVRITFDGDLEKALQIGHALVEFIADVDVLSVAEKSAVGLGTRRFAAALEVGFARGEALGLAIHLAFHVGLSVARTRAARVAFGRTIGVRRSGFALGIAAAGARRFAGRTAAAIDGGIALPVTRCATIGFACGGTIEFCRLDFAFRCAVRVAARGAGDFGLERAHSVTPDVQLGRALRGEIDGRAGRRASARDAHFALGAGAEVDAARIGDPGIGRLGKTQKRSGQSSSSKNGGKEFTHGVFLLVL